MNTVKYIRNCYRNAYAVVLYDKKVSFPKFQKQQRVIFNQYKLLAALAAFWPVKKTVLPDNNVNKKQILLDSADNLFENGHYDKCYSVLLSYEDGNDVEITWRITRALYNMAKEPALPDKEKKELILKAYYLIHDCLKKYNDHFAVHKWYAVLLDAKSAFEGSKQRITQLQNVKHHMDKAASLNPRDATTLYMLGEWCYHLTEMPWYQRQISKTLFATPPTSSYEDALQYYLRAEEAEPRFYSLNLLMIGKTYLKLKKDDQAKYYLSLAASYPAKTNDDHDANKEAAALLKYIK